MVCWVEGLTEKTRRHGVLHRFEVTLVYVRGCGISFLPLNWRIFQNASAVYLRGVFLLGIRMSSTTMQ